MVHRGWSCDKLTFIVWPYKSPISAVAGAQLNLNFYCTTMFSLLDRNAVHLMGQQCPIHLLKVKKIVQCTEVGIEGSSFEVTSVWSGLSIPQSD